MVRNEIIFREWEAKAKLLGIRDDFEIEEEYVMGRTPEGDEIPFNKKYILKQYIGKSKTVYIPPVYKLDPDCFYRNQYIEKVVMNKTVMEIGEKAFFYCSNLREVILDCKIRVLEPQVFSRCINLNHVELPNSLKIIYAYVFNNCNSLKEIDLKSVEEIYDKAFAQSGIEHITIPQSATYFTIRALSYCENLETIDIQSDKCLLEILSENIFDDLINLREIRIPKELYDLKYADTLYKIPKELIKVID